MVAFSRTWRLWVRSGAIVIPILPNNCLRNPRCGRSNLDKNGPPVIGPAVLSLRILIFQHQESRPVPVWNRDEFIAAARIEPHAAPGTMLCTEEFLSELDERSQPLFTRVTQAPLQAAGLLLGDDGVAVIRKNDHEEPVETRLFQAPLG